MNCTNSDSQALASTISFIEINIHTLVLIQKTKKLFALVHAQYTVVQLLGVTIMIYGTT